MAWAKPLYTRGRVDWAGEFLSKEVTHTDIWNLEWHAQSVEAMTIVDNWRAVHSYPLQAMKMALKQRAKRIQHDAIVAQRLKRLASIKLKLKLSKDAGHHPKLSQMQDIGGCRAVLASVAQVRELEQVFADACRKNPHRGPEYYRTSDYITHPKANGYRGVHLVYKFRSSSKEHSCYNGQRIEVQLRSRAQHYWATAVETYSTFKGEALKSNLGSGDWKRFFAIVSSAIAIKEDCPTVPETPSKMDDLVPQLRTLYTDLNVNNVLAGWSAAMKFTLEKPSNGIKTADVYLLALDFEKFTINVYPYRDKHLSLAHAHYAELEKNRPDLQVVLVSVDSLAALRTAYPNYFFDTDAFLSMLNEFLSWPFPPRA